jgi:hypothetical protein
MDSSLAQPKCGTQSRLALDADRHGYQARPRMAVEHTFGLQPLTARDATAYDLNNAFDFAQSPQPAVPMTRTPVPRDELRAIRRHPPPADVT